jgi:hypothetical protein
MTTLVPLAAPSITRVATAPASAAEKAYRAGRTAGARARGFPARAGLNLRYYGGRTIAHLTYTNVYLGGKQAWSRDDIQRIDRSLAAALRDVRLNNVLAQYYDARPTTTFKPSRVVEGPLPARVFRDTAESFVSALVHADGLSGFDLASTVFCFMLPKGIVLVDGDSRGRQRHESRTNLAASEHDEAVDSTHGLGGYHGSIRVRRDRVYYAIGVYSEGKNGIVSFDRPWKNVCATFYHELCEARTDPDVEDAIRAGDDPRANDFLGWYSPRGGEIGDMPMSVAGADLRSVMKEVPLSNGKGKVPIQLMWSNAVSGPEGPIARKH